MFPAYRALAIHLLTASGAVLALLALMAAVQEQWSTMFLWLIAAFVVDGIDGPLARRHQVTRHAPHIDGALLDLIIDYQTYVFIPAYALFQSGLLAEWAAWVSSIVIVLTSAIYFADTRMKTQDASFKGFPSCWNMVLVVFFVLQPGSALAVAVVLALAIAMFLPIRFIHPVRTPHWRPMSLTVAVIWTALAGSAAWADFETSQMVMLGVLISSLYLCGAGALQQLMGLDKATKC